MLGASSVIWENDQQKTLPGAALLGKRAKVLSLLSSLGGRL